MRLIWLTNSDANVCEDYLLAGLFRIGCVIEVRPWKKTFDEKRDPERHGGHGYTVRLGGEVRRDVVSAPETIVVSRAWRDRDEIEQTLDAHPSVPVVFFDGEDSYHGPEWLNDRVSRVFVAQCYRALARDPKIVPLPPCARADLIPEPLEEKPFSVVWGGKLSAGHGGRAPLLGPAIANNLLDEVVSFGSWSTWMWRLLKARFSISIGAAGNPTHAAGANVSYFEAGAAGASLIAYPPGLTIEPAIPGVAEFTTGAELIALCEAAHSGDLRPALPPTELRRFVESHHSHIARAHQFVSHLKALQ